MQTSCLRWLGVSHTMRLRVLVCDDQYVTHTFPYVNMCVNLQYGQLICKCLLGIGHTLKLNELCRILILSMKIYELG